MEIILAIVVASAVIFFGALISMGNERQKKAIDGLREQVVLWAVQDLKIKRERLERTVQVPDPIGWLNRILARVCGLDQKIQVTEVFDGPRALVCTYGDGNKSIILTPSSPGAIHKLMREKQSRISQFAERNPLFNLPRKLSVKEISVLNSGFLFDLELPIAWKGLTGQDAIQMDCLWVYELP